ncbi:FAD-NAD(P)-binding protein [Sphingosinicella xenopeptidilytica]|uniref:FAD-NAD(P)-binding protein n=1 Tax=Sphingosinicella xenopeptidilytica TaxID=364098 RepID=A0ABW3C6C4_SPHXN
MSDEGALKRVAIVGAGPTGLYTFFSLLEAGTPLAIAIYEQAEEAGVGMPYNDDENIRLMLANIASIEIPPLIQTYLDWLLDQDADRLARYGVEKDGLHERQFLPRILLGEYFRDQFLALVERGKATGFDIAVYESCRITDLEARENGVWLSAECQSEPQCFDLAVIATGHVWPDGEEATRSFFPSPWSGLLDADIPPRKVGIMGTSLSAIDAAMAVAAQHGRFVEEVDEALRFKRDEGSEGLTITLMSRSGILPEADFYCPIPYEPLRVATPEAIEREIGAGSDNLLDRIFALMAREIEAADPTWSARVSLPDLDADSFADAYFSDRQRHDAFRWAEYNLREVERNKRGRHTVPWRYAILRLHETVQEIVPNLSDEDRDRFDAGLSRVFIDNYAAIPSESIRRLLALREADVIRLLELGSDYDKQVEETGTDIDVDGTPHHFDVFIDARGQRPLKTKDLPFPSLRRQLLAVGEDIPDVGEDYVLLAPDVTRGRVAFGALPYLIHDRPFIQGITASAEIGSAISNAASKAGSRTRRRLGVIG